MLTLAFPSVTALKSVDFPADGFPTQPMISSQPGIKKNVITIQQSSECRMCIQLHCAVLNQRLLPFTKMLVVW